jgi:hypothetical protein
VCDFELHCKPQPLCSTQLEDPPSYLPAGMTSTSLCVWCGQGSQAQVAQWQVLGWRLGLTPVMVALLVMTWWWLHLSWGALQHVQEWPLEMWYWLLMESPHLAWGSMMQRADSSESPCLFELASIMGESSCYWRTLGLGWYFSLLWICCQMWGLYKLMIGLSLISIQIDLNCKYAEVPCSCEDSHFYASSKRGTVFGQIK